MRFMTACWLIGRSSFLLMAFVSQLGWFLVVTVVSQLLESFPGPIYARLVGDAALADRGKDERAIARALQSFGPAGATLNDITAAAGLRRDDVLAGLKTLVEAGQVVREESLAANGAGRPR